uniref:Endonuclease/exonuclease/phosphatase domain-containing protein n=1 Tax=Lactuca sativa TaxID=4236 RepID=A0A9R1V463_LACSA|nr:hypothetical protein LSAT_V11C600300440 [Lactuca sativa]
MIGRWEGIQGDTIFANVYGPHAPTEKKKLWEAILQIKRDRGGTWVVFGDFNTVMRKDEKYNSQFCPHSAFHFNRFIRKAGLNDIRMGGHRYTYFCQTNIKLSKLDGFLVCNNFLQIFLATSVTTLPRETLDHYPIILKTSLPDFRNPPFCFFNSWMSREGFDNIVIQAWHNFKGFGTPNQFLAAKLKFLKNEIKKWRAKDYPSELLELKRIKERVHAIDYGRTTDSQRIEG